MWKAAVLLCFLAIGALGSLVTDQLHWTHFKAKYDRAYKSTDEERLRFEIFQNNLRTIETHNALYEKGEKSYEMGVNQFSDMNEEEFVSFLNRQLVATSDFPGTKADFSGVKVPDSVDWREKGAVTKVKDQGSCGSCWAFGPVASVESFNFLKNNELVDLSPQQVLDCDSSDYGCRGGYPNVAMEYIKNHGLEKEDDYPYVAENGTCLYKESDVVVKISGYVETDKGDEDAIAKAVGSLGPISVVMDAVDLYQYKSGILEGSKCFDIYTNHAVLAVGYGYDNATGFDYWIIKNSWGDDWGEDGYFKIKRGSNECAIGTKGIYPIL